LPDGPERFVGFNVVSSRVDWVELAQLRAALPVPP